MVSLLSGADAVKVVQRSCLVVLKFREAVADGDLLPEFAHGRPELVLDGDLLTSVYSLKEAGSAFEEFRNGGVCKVLILPPQISA